MISKTWHADWMGLIKFRDRLLLHSLWGVSVLAHIVLFSPLPLWLRTGALFLILGFVPGYFLVDWLLGEDAALGPFDRLLYTIGAGFALWVWGVLLLSYAPGPLNRVALLAVFNGVALVFYVLAFRRQRRTNRPPWPLRFALPGHAWLPAGLALLLVAGGFLRLANLAYSDFQGDEAKVMMHALAVVQGNEDALFAYRKGPVEILLPAAFLSVFGMTTEGSARLLFAFANLVCVLAVFNFGRRLLGSLAGWLAALLLAFDGYFIGTARIVQYTPFIFLMGVLTLYPLVRLAQSDQDEDDNVQPPVVGYLLFVALFAATGIAAHYEGVLPLAPALYLLWRIWQQQALRPALVRGLALAVAVGCGLVAVFYVPFLTHPHFAATVERYGGDVVGQQAALYNHLTLFAARGSLYNTAYAFYLAVAAALVALARVAVRSRTLWGRALALAIVLAVTGIALAPDRFGGGGVDWAPFVVTAALLLPLVHPAATMAERLLWLWVAPGLVAAAFLIKDPNTHFYVFYTPWMLITGGTLVWLWEQVQGRVGHRPAVGFGLVGLTLMVLVFGGYAYGYFVYTGVEVVRHWREQTVIPRGLVHTQLEGHALFGMPHDSGWRVIAQLYADGALQGSYASNMRHWIPEWYTRSAVYCEANPDLLFLQQLDRHTEREKLRAQMGDAYHRWGEIRSRGETQMEIYQRTPVGQPTLIEIDTSAGAPHRGPFTVDFEPAGLELSPPLTPLAYRFGNQLQLLGYHLSRREARPGEQIQLTLRWQALQPLEREYQLFTQIIGPENRMVGQRDTMPDCNEGPTWQWQPGNVYTGFYQIPIFAGELPGDYPLWIGLYDLQTGERLAITDGAGASGGDALLVATISVTP
jgi:4-amino-4-deoxy-L-arabinose transferase-like glycosyltransferase